MSRKIYGRLGEILFILQGATWSYDKHPIKAVMVSLPFWKKLPVELSRNVAEDRQIQVYKTNQTGETNCNNIVENITSNNDTLCRVTFIFIIKSAWPKMHPHCIWTASGVGCHFISLLSRGRQWHYNRAYVLVPKICTMKDLHISEKETWQSLKMLPMGLCCYTKRQQCYG